jgi:hypothetical protein
MYFHFRVLTLIMLLPVALTAQSEIPRLHPHPVVEVEVPITPDEAWKTLNQQPHVSFATTDEAFERHRVPMLRQELRSWSGIAWRGERVHSQVLVWSTAPISQLRAEPVALTGAGGTIPTTAIRVRFVRYVLSEFPYNSRQANCEEIDRRNAYLVPDLLDPVPRFDLPASTTRPIWITIDVPRSTQPGLYSGVVELKAEGGLTVPLQLKLEVQGGTVPEPADWKFRVDFWQNPWAVAQQHRVAPWSEAHLSILRQHLRALADMGQTYVSAYITHSPWKDDTYIPDGTMVEWIREPDGSFRFDYGIFDTYVELAMSCGINDAICCFTLIPWNNRVRYLDKASGEYRWANWAMDSPEYERFWRVFLGDLRQHLVQRQWFSKTYLEVNERSLEDTLRAVKIARADSPNWKLTYAGNYHRELAEVIDDLCTLIGSEIPASEVTARRGRHQTSTFYVCCTPALPNNFPFSPPTENVWMGWYAAAAKLDGFLRWAWDNWPEDPTRDARHTRFPAGDTFLVYPGPLDSIRVERLREGFVDYEKLLEVRRQLAGNQGAAVRKATADLDKALRVFNWERVKNTNGSTVAQDVRAAREALAAASRIAFERK